MDHAIALPMWDWQGTQMAVHGSFSPGRAHRGMSKQEASVATSSNAGFQPKALPTWEADLYRLACSQDAADRSHLARVLCLEALAASVAHELEQSLSDLSSHADACLKMLSAGSLSLEGARQKAQLAIQDGKRAAAVVQRMWSLFAKSPASGEAVDLNDAATQALALTAQKLQARRVTLRRELDPDLPRVNGDSLQLQQVILNLVNNGAESMHEIHDRPRELVLRTQRAEGGRVRLSVRDAGQGFEPRTVDRLFDAFYTTKADGMGIGLFLSRWIVENHGGAISAALNDGPGATFSFTVPCRQA